jgi:hypothetical protein
MLNPGLFHRSLSKRRKQRRRGAATLWMLIWAPALLVMFSVLVGVANLWLARVELENALESAALAAVKEWGDANGAGGTLAAREVGVGYASANFVRRDYVLITTNYAAGTPNENAECDVQQSPPRGNLIFGSIDDVTDQDDVTFRGDVEPTGAPALKFGVRAQAIVPVQSFLGSAFLGSIGSYCVQAKATAVYDGSAPNNKVRLIRIDTFICP